MCIRDRPYAILANLPYNVGTALFVGWLGGEQWPPLWSSLTLMFQQEVAERIVAQPNTDAYGRLAVLSQWRATPKIAMRVHRSAFTPPPKVMSAIIHVAVSYTHLDVYKRQALMAQMEDDRVNKRAQMYMRDLRRDAIIEYN